MNTPTPKDRHTASDNTWASFATPQPDTIEPELRVSSNSEPGYSGKLPSTNIVLPRSPLIGRKHEVAAVQHLLLQEWVGLLTLTGPGGIGKTRLAMHAASTLLDHFVDGIYFVSLAPIRDPDLAVVAIAETLGVRETSGQTLPEALQGRLQHRQILLVLDNFEQILAAAPLLVPLLAACAQLKFLVTSRSPLHLYGEHEFPVPPLALPDLKHLHANTIIAPALAQVASVTLFVERAMAVKPDFVLTAANAVALAEICRALDGLPLALELAAAKIKLFSPTSLLARLQQRLTLLTGGPQDMPARQRTLRDEIAWSYELLLPEEQRLFRRLSIFAGGFSLGAAQAIGDAEGAQALDILEGIARLVDQNMLKQIEEATLAAPQPRFTLLETMREYALEQLMASGEAEAIRQCHANFYLELVIAATSVPSWDLVQLTMEHDNLRAALTWGLQESHRTDVALHLVAALAGVWVTTGYSREGRRWAEAALARTSPADHTELRAKLLLGSAYLALWQGDPTTAQLRVEEGMTLARELGEQTLIYRGLIYLGWMAHGQREYRRAVAFHEQALAIVREAGDKLLTAETLLYLGGVAQDERDYEQALALYEESLALRQEVGDDWDIADILQYIGQVAQTQGDGARAAALFRDSLTRWRRLGLLRWKGIVHCLDGLAALYEGQQQFEEAACLFAAAEELRDVLHGAPAPPSHPSGIAKHTALRAQMGETAFAAAWAAGRLFSSEEAVDYALALPANFQSTLFPAESKSNLQLPASGITYPADLTTREVEVLQLLAHGLTYVQIADKLVVSRRTINAHVSSIYSKLAVHSRAAATRFAIDHHLV